RAFFACKTRACHGSCTNRTCEQPCIDDQSAIVPAEQKAGTVSHCRPRTSVRAPTSLTPACSFGRAQPRNECRSAPRMQVGGSTAFSNNRIPTRQSTHRLQGTRAVGTFFLNGSTGHGVCLVDRGAVLRRGGESKRVSSPHIGGMHIRRRR